jgi:hypothetical protein
VVQQVLNVLQQKRPRPFRRQYARDIEKQRALRSASKSMRPTQSIFLAHARNRKRLAGKSRDQNVMIGNLVLDLLANIARDRLVIPEIRSVSLPRPRIPLAREYAASTRRLEPHPHPADPGEKIDEAE